MKNASSQEDNLSYKFPRPSDYVYAKLAQQVYAKGGSESNTSLPDGWRVLKCVDKTQDDGYFGAAYSDREDNKGNRPLA